MQGTGVITLAAALSAVKVTGVPMREQKLVVFGAGTVGVISLLDTVRHTSPTILLGTSTAHGAFTREVVEAMSAGLGDLGQALEAEEA
jgi:malic enzyme